MATAEIVETKGINRREFLYYIWGASMALVSAQSAGLILWFLIPRFGEGQFGGKFSMTEAQIPTINTPPVSNDDGRFWLVNLDTENPNELMGSVDGDSTDGIQGVVAIYKVCTHLGCIYDWVASNNRFECPCHGSKYRLDGRRVESPAPRDLDRFKVEAFDASGSLIGESPLNEAGGYWEPLAVPEGTVELKVDTGQKKEGPSQKLLCEILGTC